MLPLILHKQCENPRKWELNTTTQSTQGQFMHLGPSSAELTDPWGRPLNLSRNHLEKTYSDSPPERICTYIPCSSFPLPTLPRGFLSNLHVVSLSSISKEFKDFISGKERRYYLLQHQWLYMNKLRPRGKKWVEWGHIVRLQQIRSKQALLWLQKQCSIIPHNFLIALVNIVSIFIFRTSQKNLATMERKIW